MRLYDSRPVTLDPGLTALALRALRQQGEHYPFVGRRKPRKGRPSKRPASGDRPTPYLLIVARDHPRLLTSLKRAFGTAARIVQVLPDRRVGDRRRTAQKPDGKMERRQVERRRPPAAAWRLLGVLVVPRRQR